MTHKLINIGFGNSVVSRRVVAIISPNASPIKRLRDEAREEKRLIDATQGRRTRSVIITDSIHVISHPVRNYCSKIQSGLHIDQKRSGRIRYAWPTLCYLWAIRCGKIGNH